MFRSGDRVGIVPTDLYLTGCVTARFLKLSIGGGVLGVVLGIVISFLIDGASIGTLQMNTKFSGDIAVLALGVSAVIGLAAGIYPAMRAAALDPIEALRHE